MTETCPHTLDVWPCANCGTEEACNHHQSQPACVWLCDECERGLSWTAEDNGDTGIDRFMTFLGLKTPNRSL